MTLETKKNESNESRKPSDRVLFWIIVISAIIVVILMVTASFSYQFYKAQAEATIVAAPTATAEFLETHYQKGIGYMNVGRWFDAKVELEIIFEINPTYKDVQSRLVEIYAEIDQLTPLPTSTPTLQSERTPSQIDQSTPLPTSTPVLQPEKTPPTQRENSQISVSAGLVAYYPFNGNADDVSPNDNHGQVYGAVLTEGRFGNPESAYDFDGADDRIEIANNSDTNFSSGDFSIVGWLKTSHTHNDSNGQAIIDKYPQKGKPWTLRLQPDGRIRFISDDSVYSNVVVNDGVWHQFVALRSNSTIKLFIDGQIQGAALSTTSASNLIILCIGCIHDYSLRRLYKGSIDDVRIYNRALTETEIQSLYKESGN